MAGKSGVRLGAGFVLGIGLALGVLGACEKRPTENDSVAPHPQHAMQALSSSDVVELRQATSRFHRLAVANAEGYAIFGGCFSDPALGGMGQHYANDRLIADSAIQLRKPELLLYETIHGQPQLVAVEYIVFVDDWLAAGHAEPPRLFNTDFHINSTLLAKPFYLLHAWVWRENPSGLLSDWNPRVSCVK